MHGHHFTDVIFKCIFLNENLWILNKISLRFVPKVPVNNIPSLVQIMAWRRPGDKPLSVIAFVWHVFVVVVVLSKREQSEIRYYSNDFILSKVDFISFSHVYISAHVSYSRYHLCITMDSGKISSISLLLMPWLLASPGHQLLWCRQCWVNGSMLSIRISLLRKDRKCLYIYVYIYFRKQFDTWSVKWRIISWQYQLKTNT